MNLTTIALVLLFGGLGWVVAGMLTAVCFAVYTSNVPDKLLYAMPPALIAATVGLGLLIFSTILEER